MKHTNDEILIQRCVDGELSDHERAALLTRLHQEGSAESWKTLALSYIEQQVFSNVFADDADGREMLSFQLARPLPADRKDQRAVPTSWLHRRLRPWFTLAVSLFLGISAGVGGHYWLESQEMDQPAVAAAAAIPAGLESAAATPVAPSQFRTAQAPIMNVRLTGLGARDSEPVSVPVYSPEQWQSLQQPAAAVPEEVRQLLESQGMTVDRERHWYRVRLDDGREILVPTETMRVRHAVQ